MVDRLIKKFETAKKLVPKPVIEGRGDNKIGIVSLGSCDGAVREAIDILVRRGQHVDYLRVRGFPFGEEVEAFLESHEQIFVVEQNRDAQLKSLLILETAVEKSKLHSVLHYSGLPIPASFVVDGISKVLEDEEPRRALKSV